MSSRISEFRDNDCEVVAISTDDIETHQRWLTLTPQQGGIGELQFPLASDVEGEVCASYGVYVKRQNVAQRGVFIIDPNGVLQYQLVHSMNVGRSTDELLRVLDALQSGGLCPADRKAGESHINVQAELGPNRVLGQYRIESELGKGAFGTVYRAHDQTLNRTVALKVLQQESEESKGLIREARAAAALNHPNVCTIFGIEEIDGVTMIVMEFVEGESLADRIKSSEMSPQIAESLIRQAFAGMSAAHKAGVVHGDLKPANMMITADDSLRIMDFGMAQQTANNDSFAETMLSGSISDTGLRGTPMYMAPEITLGESQSPASDVFSLGLVLFEMLGNRPAVSGRNLMEILRNIEQFEMPAEVSAFPVHLQEILHASLEVSPKNRASADDLLHQLS